MLIFILNFVLGSPSTTFGITVFNIRNAKSGIMPLSTILIFDFGSVPVFSVCLNRLSILATASDAREW